MRDDRGFTLIEVLVTTVLMLLVGAVAMTSLVGYARVQDHQSTGDTVVSVLRTSAQRALAEGRTYCVSFDTAAETWQVRRTSCSATGPLVSSGRARTGVDLAAAAFTAAPTQPCPTSSACVYFTPRGTASPGSLNVVRETSVITVTVEGLSSRVSRS